MVRTATELRPGMVIRVDGEPFRVTDAVFHAGGGKMRGSVHARLRNVRTGSDTDRRFRPEERFEELELHREAAEYLYDDGDQCVFMHVQTYEQIPMPRVRLGSFARFIRPNQQLDLEFLDEQPVGIVSPRTVDLRVERTAEALHAQDMNVFKEAVLENGIQVLVPQFVRRGDLVRIDVETGRYVDRVR